MKVEYREEPCRSALNRVTRMPFAWSLNPYMGRRTPLEPAPEPEQLPLAI